MKNNFILCNLVNLKFIERKFWLFLFLFSSLFLFSQSYRTPGTYTWTAPCGVTSITVEAWGGGGAGGGTGNANLTKAGGGGGGGGYIRSILPVVPGNTYTIIVGSGGIGVSAAAGGNGDNSTFNGTNIIALGGKGGGATNTTIGGLAGTGAGAGSSTGNGTILHTGGDGFSGSSSLSGSGGGAAGTNNNGENASSTAGGAGGANGGGNGGTGKSANSATGNNGSAPGGGGSGAFRTNNKNGTGGNGGAGQVIVTYTPIYCVPVARDDSEYINNVSTTGATTNIGNLGSGPGTVSTGYSSFCNIGAVAQQNSTFNVVFNANVGSTFGWAIWIDWNDNGTFESGERVYNSNGYINDGTASITIPAAQAVGIYTMRILADYNNTDPTNPCSFTNFFGRYGEAEDYKLEVTPLPPCTGTPGVGTASATPTSGATSSVFSATVASVTAGGGITYQWESSANGTSGWTAVAGATNATSAITAVNILTTTYYRLKVTCTNAGGGSVYSNIITYTTGYCTPVISNGSNPANNYIDLVKFMGTLNDVQTASTYSTNPRGYQDWTNEPKSQQIQGGGVNVFVSTQSIAYYKAWVDWNKDGSFADDAVERVFNVTDTAPVSTTFGFVIPPATPPGDYRIRIRINNSGFGASDFDSCETISRTGETEDYLFTVLASCAAQITAVTDYERCGTGNATISAQGTAGTTKLRWYTTLTGGTFAYETNANASGFGSLALTNVSQTTTYYVSAFNGNCESRVRIPVVINVKSMPEVTFDVQSPNGDFCGDTDRVILSTNSDEETVELLKEDFEGGTLGKFTAGRITTGGDNNTAGTQWTNQQSVFVPSNRVWKPAISSGYYGNRFGFITSDIGFGTTVNKTLTSNIMLDTTNFTELNIDFSYYFSYYGSVNEGFFVEISVNNGAWVTLKTITNNTSIGTKFNDDTITLSDPAYLNKNDIKIRFRYRSGWADGLAIDNIKLYGKRPLVAAFSYSGTIGVYNNTTSCDVPYDGSTPSICLKPTPLQLETVGVFNLSATVTLSNTCAATGAITITNNNKFWQPTNTAVNWGTANWLPSTSPPTIDKCVKIRKPINIPATTDAFAKNIRIEPNPYVPGEMGKITVSGSLTVNDIISNTSGDPRNLIVKSDGNLVQIDDSVVNTTPIAVRRIHDLTDDRKEYNYLSSPVKDQNMKLIFGDVTSNVPFVTVLNEATNYFVNAKAADYGIAARGFSVREPKTTYVGVSAEGIAANEAEYKGLPNNGTIPDLALAFTDTSHGFNVVGNPYPSNLDIIDLFNNSVNASDIDTTFQFWDNSINNFYTQQGTAYAGWSYATFNVANGPNGLGTAAPGKPLTVESGPTLAGTKVPTRMVKTSQAFMVRALKAGAKMKFKNTMRKITAAPFFGKENVAENYYRLEYTTPDSLVIQNAVSYFAGGKTGFGIEDSKIPHANVSDAMFSLIDNEKAIINGRPMFTDDDIIPLGIRGYMPGTYSIKAIDQVGIFANGQAVYLKDKQLGIITDISTEAYTFTSVSGEFTNRFEIVYKPGGVLASDNVTKANIQLYRDQLDFVLQSSGKKIVHIELYDMSGRLMLSRKANDKEVRFNAETLVDSAYVLKAQLEGGEIFTKKLRK